MVEPRCAPDTAVAAPLAPEHAAAFANEDRREALRAIKEAGRALATRDDALDEKARLGMSTYLRPEGLWSKAVESDFDRWQRSAPKTKD